MTTNNDFTFVRHGETDWSARKIMHGQTDVPMNEEGKRQAREIAEELARGRFDICICSPLSRAVETAKAILKYHRLAILIVDDRLKELNKGELEGSHARNDAVFGEEKERWMKKHGAESKEDFFDRVRESILEIDARNKGKRILVVSHCGTMRMANFVFNDPGKPVREAYYDKKFENCRAYKFN